jgi:hypothetical protein
MERPEEEGSDEGETSATRSRAREDDRKVHGDYYLWRDEVDQWAKEGLEEMMKGHSSDPVCALSFSFFSSLKNILGMERGGGWLLRTMEQYARGDHFSSAGYVRRDWSFPVSVSAWLHASRVGYGSEWGAVSVFIPSLKSFG